MLRTYVNERTYVLLKYDARLKYPLCYDDDMCSIGKMKNLEHKITQKGGRTYLITYKKGLEEI